ncbi:FHA domain-containing protein [Streptomyces sp. NPDC048665]|uniref:FHA domain-containing protein n=1 Tax=Streptomyces sp. NPDC048665 TaxID=3155490 RepID=UPI0034125BC8
MPTCPNGHQSGSDDWCEVCGHRMAGAVPPPPPPPPAGGYGFPPQGGPAGGRPPAAAAPEPELCPQCRTPREGGAPFCEECRWNFLTNTATSYTPAAPRPPQPRFDPPSATYGGGDGYEYQGSRPSQVNRPAEPIPSFGSEPSGPTPFGGERTPPGPPTTPGPPAFGGAQLPGQSQGPGQGQGPAGPGGPAGPPGFGAGPGQVPGQRPGGQGGPGGPSGPSGFGAGPGQGPGGPTGVPSFGGAPSVPGAPTPPGGPSGFGADPSRPVPPPPGPTPPAGPGGAPQAFQQSGPPVPPAFPGETARPPAGGPPGGGPSFGGGEDDWVLSPPSSAGPAGPGHGSAPGGPQGGPGGGYGYPQPGSQPPAPGAGFPPAAGPATWTATIGPDREYFMAMMQRSGPEAAGLNLPAYSPEQQRTLSGNQVTIGRRRHSTGDTPDIDLAVPPEDPGVSHQHAVLVQQPDGTWAVVDQNSTNGTTVNLSEEPIQPFVPVPLQDGDRVHVGAWTTITVRRG